MAGPVVARHTRLRFRSGRFQPLQTLPNLGLPVSLLWGSAGPHAGLKIQAQLLKGSLGPSSLLGSSVFAFELLRVLHFDRTRDVCIIERNLLSHPIGLLLGQHALVELLHLVQGVQIGSHTGHDNVHIRRMTGKGAVPSLPGLGVSLPHVLPVRGLLQLGRHFALGVNALGDAVNVETRELVGQLDDLLNRLKVASTGPLPNATLVPTRSCSSPSR
jgi:hypothetical protein